jgi:hypothetical protein
VHGTGTELFGSPATGHRTHFTPSRQIDSFSVHTGSAVGNTALSLSRLHVVRSVQPGPAIAQAVSPHLTTAAARVRAQVRLCVICCGRSSTGAGFLLVLRFPLPICIPPIAPQSSSSSSETGIIGQTVAAVPNGLSLTPLKIIIIKYMYHLP